MIVSIAMMLAGGVMAYLSGEPLYVVKWSNFGDCDNAPYIVYAEFR